MLTVFDFMGTKNKFISKVLCSAVVMIGLSSCANRDQIIRMGLYEKWDNLELPFLLTAPSNYISGNVFETLVSIGPNGEFLPNAARSWSVNQNWTHIVFTIDTKRRYSDGSYLTPTDFKKSWENSLRNMVGTKGEGFDLFENVIGYSDFQKTNNISGIVAKKNVVEIYLQKSTRPFLNYMASPRYAAYKIVDGKQIGTGPYYYASISDANVVLKPNQYSLKHVSNNGIEMRYITLNKMYEHFLNSDLDIADSIPEYYSKKWDSPKLTAQGTYVKQHLVLWLNGSDGVFHSENNRRSFQTYIHENLNSQSNDEITPQFFLKLQEGSLSDSEIDTILKEDRLGISNLFSHFNKDTLVIACPQQFIDHWFFGFLKSNKIRYKKIIKNRLQLKNYEFSKDNEHHCCPVQFTVGVRAED